MFKRVVFVSVVFSENWRDDTTLCKVVLLEQWRRALYFKRDRKVGRKFL